jgi:hypothetical protein
MIASPYIYFAVGPTVGILTNKRNKLTEASVFL